MDNNGSVVLDISKSSTRHEDVRVESKVLPRPRFVDVCLANNTAVEY